jgi:uncharacterized protein (TIGR02996 family)
MAAKPLAREMAAWLAAIREGGDDARAVFADWLRERGHELAADAVVARHCQTCGVPDDGKTYAKDRFGKWHEENAVHQMNSDVGLDLFGWDFDFRFYGGLCEVYDGAWLCGGCRLSAIAAKAHATKRARRAAAKAEEPDLFSGTVGEE